MSRDGSGNYELPNSPVIPGTIISSTHYNTTLEDIKNALTESLPRSGEAPMEAPIKLVDGAPTSPAIGFNAENSGLYRPEAGVLGFIVSSGERMRISGGNLIIGSTVDTGEMLQVNGLAKITGGANVSGGLNVLGGGSVAGPFVMQQIGFTDGSANSLDLSGGLTVGGTGITTNGLAIGGDGGATGNFLVGGNLIAAGVAAGPSSFDSIQTPTIQVDGASNLSTLNVASTSNFVGTATFATLGGTTGNFTTVNSENANIGAFLNATNVQATSVSTTNLDLTATSGTSNLNVGTGRTADGASILNFRTAAGNSTYNFRINRAGGANGIAYFQQTGSGRMAFENDTNSEFRFSTFATGGATQKFTAPNLTAGADFAVHGVSLSSVGNVNFFFQNGSQTTTQNYYSVSRNATAGIGTHVFRVGGDSATSGSATTALTISETAVLPALQVQNIVGSETAPSYTFSGDADTGLYRSASNNLDFSTGGVRRLQIDSAGRLYQYSTGGELLTMKTTGNNGLFNLDVATGTANINNLSWYLTSAGTAMLLLRNDAKTGYVSPIQITRNATSGVAAISLKVGGDANTTGSDATAATITNSTGSTQGKLLVGHTSPDVFFNNADATSTDNFQILSYKTGATGPSAMLGSDGSNNSLVGFSRTNTGSKRIVHSQIAGVSVSSTAGAERGRLDFGTKAAADAGVVSRLTIDETAATFAVPVYSVRPIKTSGSIANGQILSVSAGFTINTSDIVAGGEYRIYNNSDAAITLTQGAGVVLRSTAGTGNRTLPARSMVVIHAVSATELVFPGSYS